MHPSRAASWVPANKGRRYPADPPRVEEIVAVMRQAGSRPHGLRIRGLIVVLWRAGLRIAEALALAETDLEPTQGAILVRSGKAGVDGSSAWTSGAGSSFVRGAKSAGGFRLGHCSA
jgi:site-specific recombinase XerC